MREKCGNLDVGDPAQHLLAPKYYVFASQEHVCGAGRVVRKVDGLRTVSKWLVLLGALNWGLVGLVSYNLVDGLLGFSPVLVRLTYLLVGAAGLWGTYAKLTKKK